MFISSVFSPAVFVSGVFVPGVMLSKASRVVVPLKPVFLSLSLSVILIGIVVLFSALIRIGFLRCKHLTFCGRI